jgi:hypothetical protein
MRARATALAVLITLGLVVAPALPAHAVSCEASSATTLPVSLAGRPITIYGDDIGEESMKLLWDLGMQWNTHDFGKAIASEQNWFDECKYPGIGLGTGSGWSWHDRNVTLWIWADAVDMAQARATILNRVAITPDVIITTTTTEQTTTTTTPPAVAATTTTTEPEPTATATAQVLDEPTPATTTTTTTSTTTTAVPVSAAASFAIITAEPAATLRTPLKPVVKKKVVKKPVVKKKVVAKKK